MTQYLLECSKCLALIVNGKTNKARHTEWHRFGGMDFHDPLYRIIKIPSDDVADGAS